MTRPSSILPVANTCSENSSSNTMELDLGVWPLRASQWAVAFITPSGTTSRGQTCVHLWHETHCQMMSLSRSSSASIPVRIR